MGLITSTVLVSLFIKNDEYYLLFTERSKILKNHPGEISFPGGKIEPNESTLNAVIRETLEEINAGVLSIADTLDPVMTYVSDHTILPYIGTLDISNLKVNPDEVEKIHIVPLNRFFQTKMTIKRFEYKNKYISSPVWDFGDFFVWGATGRILSLFKEWLKKENFHNDTSVL